MQTYNRILVVLDSYEEQPQSGNQLPVEVSKAIRFISDKQEAEIFLLLKL